MELGSIHGVTVLLQPFKVHPFTAKYFNNISLFSNSNFLFSSHTLEWLHNRSLNYLVCLFLSYLSHVFIFLMKLLLLFTLGIPYKQSKAIYKLKLLHRLTMEHTLHSRVKSSNTQTRDCCFSEL